MKDSLEFFNRQYSGIPKLYVLAGMEELGENSRNLHYEVGSNIKLEKDDLVIFIGEKASWMAPAVLENDNCETKIIVLPVMEDAIPIVEDFEGVVLFKGSRSNRLEKLLPTWAVEDNLDRNNEKC